MNEDRKDPIATGGLVPHDVVLEIIAMMKAHMHGNYISVKGVPVPKDEYVAPPPILRGEGVIVNTDELLKRIEALEAWVKTHEWYWIKYKSGSRIDYIRKVDGSCSLYPSRAIAEIAANLFRTDDGDTVYTVMRLSDE